MMLGTGEHFQTEVLAVPVSKTIEYYRLAFSVDISSHLTKNDDISKI
jgi:hypothetical protein